MKRIHIKLFISCVASFAATLLGCAQTMETEILSNLNDMFVEKVVDSQFVFIDFTKIDTCLIPELIQIIDHDSLLTASTCFSEYSSVIPNIYVGEVAAKYIEKIINPEFDSDRILKEGQRYSLNLIDMRVIKDLYSKWWQEQQLLSDEQLIEYKKRGALYQTMYTWAPCL